MAMTEEHGNNIILAILGLTAVVAVLGIVMMVKVY